jgi:hypothetical protein
MACTSSADSNRDETWAHEYSTLRRMQTSEAHTHQVERARRAGVYDDFAGMYTRRTVKQWAVVARGKHCCLQQRGGWQERRARVQHELVVHAIDDLQATVSRVEPTRESHLLLRTEKPVHQEQLARRSFRVDGIIQCLPCARGIVCRGIEK